MKTNLELTLTIEHGDTPAEVESTLIHFIEKVDLGIDSIIAEWDLPTIEDEEATARSNFSGQGLPLWPIDSLTARVADIPSVRTPSQNRALIEWFRSRWFARDTCTTCGAYLRHIDPEFPYYKKDRNGFCSQDCYREHLTE